MPNDECLSSEGCNFVLGYLVLGYLVFRGEVFIICVKLRSSVVLLEKRWWNGRGESGVVGQKM